MCSFRKIKKELLAEFLGTFLFLAIGMGCVASLNASGLAYSQWDIALIWGMAVALGVFCSASISGAHLNPTITIVLAIFKDFPKERIIPYIIVQFLAAIFAAFMVFTLYHYLFGVKNIANASIFTTFPNANINIIQAFITEFFITAILVFCIFNFSDLTNKLVKTALLPLLVGLTVALIGGAFGPLTGFAMNAARDLGPRIFLAMAGWDIDIFTADRSIPYFLVPLIAPILGGIFGAFIYENLNKTSCGLLNKS